MSVAEPEAIVAETGGGLRLSIVVPTFNRAASLALCLSRLCLEVEPHRAVVELIVAENWSDDDTTAILQTFVARHPWLRVIRPERHLPTAEANIAFALPHCFGEFCWFFGDDDDLREGGVAQILALLSAQPADFYLLNSALYYAATGEVGPEYIPLRQAGRVCAIDELVARVGFTTIAASISSVVLRTALYRAAGLDELLQISPIFTHVAAYLRGFRGASCVLGAPSPVIVREAGSARDSFATLSDRTGRRMWEPFSIGPTRLLNRLIDEGVVEPSFASRVIELGHDGRFYLLNWIISQHLVQADVWLDSQIVGDALRPAEIDDLARLASTSDMQTRETVLGLRRVTAALAALSEDGHAPGVDGEPSAAWVLAAMGDAGKDVQTLVIDWARREVDTLRRRNAERYHVRQFLQVAERQSGYILFRQGWDHIAVKEADLERAGALIDTQVVDPAGSPPHSLVSATAAGLRLSIAETMANRGLTRGDTTADTTNLREALPRHAYLFDAPRYAAVVGLPRAEDGGYDMQVVVDHFLTYGLDSGVAPGPWLDVAWYWRTYEGDRAFSDRAALTAYLAHSGSGERAPSLWFDAEWYFHNHASVRERIAAGAALNVVHDYVGFGAAEGLSANPWFDEAWYRQQNPDTAARIARGEVISAFHDYLLTGRADRADPGPLFSETAYLEANATLKDHIGRGRGFATCFDHWLMFGRDEGRDRGLRRTRRFRL